MGFNFLIPAPIFVKIPQVVPVFGWGDIQVTSSSRKMTQCSIKGRKLDKEVALASMWMFQSCINIEMKGNRWEERLLRDDRRRIAWSQQRRHIALFP